MSKYDLMKMRQKMKEKSAGRAKDPNQFIPPTVKDGEKKTYRFFVLPPLSEGDTTADGQASRAMDLFHLPNGSHWVNNKPNPCPRIHDDGACAMCEMAFEFMKETQDKKKRSEIARNYLPQQRHAVNIYFLNDPVNPEELRGQNRWFNAPKSVLDIWEPCIMRDDAGDPADPQAYGVFYDEESAYVFQLEVAHKGGYNNYENSKFLANLGRIPIARNKAADGKSFVPNPERTEAILNGRFDLYTKFDPRDPEKLKEIVSTIINQEDSDGTDGSGFNEDESRKVAPAQQARPANRAPVAAARPKPAPAVEAPLVEEGISSDDLSGEGALIDAPPVAVTKPKVAAPKAKPAAAATPKPAPAPAPAPTPAAAVEAEDDDTELKSLLAEIESAE